jgi:opacity protein-like surface antigen
MKTMFKKIALCAMLVLILAPAAVMAAGQQGQAQSIVNNAGNCLNVQHQIAGNTMAQENFQNGQGQGSGNAMQNGDARMLQNRSCDQTCEQDQAGIRNMIRDQIRLNSDPGPAGESQGAGSNDVAGMLQNRSCDQTYEQDQAMVRNMTRDQIRLGSESVQQQNGTADSVQNRLCPAKGNGQNILAGFADQLGAQFRHMGGIFQAPGQ